MSKFRKGLLVVALAAIAAFVLPSNPASAFSDPGVDNPQKAKPSAAAAAVAAPTQCLKFDLLTADGHQVRKTYNMYTEWNTPDVWLNVPCGDAVFTVPRGQRALVDLSATAELDCASPETTGWCQGRFLVNGASLSVHPSNEGRSDSYAWDAGKSGYSDWSAHALDQEYAVSCPTSTTTNAPCAFRVQLQVNLTSGANYLWLDDLTVRVDANYGPVTVTAVNP